MGLPKKGSRILLVDEYSYRYKISGNDGHIDLIVESDEYKGQKMVVSFHYNSLEQVGSTPRQTTQITPSIIKDAIVYGIKKGWTPKKSGKVLKLGFISDNNKT